MVVVSFDQKLSQQSTSRTKTATIMFTNAQDHVTKGSCNGDRIKITKFFPYLQHSLEICRFGIICQKFFAIFLCFHYCC